MTDCFVNAYAVSVYCHHVVISLLVRVATLSQFCCIDLSVAITVKTRPAVFLAGSGFVVTILAISDYHTAGPLRLVL